MTATSFNVEHPQIQSYRDLGMIQCALTVESLSLNIRPRNNDLRIGLMILATRFGYLRMTGIA
jgi:hypothetical protein